MKKTLILALMLLSSLAAFSDNGVLVGDVNDDGFITSADVTAIYNFILNSDETSLINGDVNSDGTITSADVTVIYNILLSDLPVVTEYTVNGVSFKMVQVNGGTFTMGATAEQVDDANSIEFPAHEVTLSSFAIGQTEVTQELWQAVMSSNPSNFNGGSYGINLQRPVECVSWNNCKQFIAKLNEMTGKQFRMPTEAEWEFAARGGNHSKSYKYAGNNTIGVVAWYGGNSGDETHSVASKLANELGIYDMSGNVFEWCNDWYGSYSSAPQTNPTGPASGGGRVFRGGCWNNAAGLCRVSYRVNLAPGYYGYNIGLRLAL